MSELHGKKVRVHLNLHNGLFSVKCGKQPIVHLAQVHLRQVVFRVSGAGHKRAEAEQTRNVHAWAKGIFSDLPTGPTVQAATAISYNYHVGAYFYHVANQRPVYTAAALFLINKLAYA